MKASKSISTIRDNWQFYAAYISILAAAVVTHRYFFRPPEYYNYYPYWPSLMAWVTCAFIAVFAVGAGLFALDCYVLDAFRKTRRFDDPLGGYIVVLGIVGLAGTIAHLVTWMIGWTILSYIDQSRSYGHVDPRLLWYCGLAIAGTLAVIAMKKMMDGW